MRHLTRLAGLARRAAAASPVKVEPYVSPSGYGWSLTLLVLGQHRARFNSTGATTRMPPRITTGADENCNRAVTLVAWPLGHLDIWWEPRWRTDEDGTCDKCLAEFAEADRQATAERSAQAPGEN